MMISWVRDNKGDNENVFRSLQSLIKYNGGNWKSEKQMNFIFNCWAEDNTETRRGHIKKFFGVNVDENQRVIFVEGVLTAAPGIRGEIPYTLVYVADDQGIVAVYRVRYCGNLRDGARPNPNKIELKWKRNLN